MVLKRPFQYEEDKGENGDPKRCKSVIRNVLGMLSVQDMAAKMEPFLRLVVRDEVEKTVSRVLRSSFRSSFKQTQNSEERGLILRFVNKPPSTIFTGSKIEAEDGNPIGLELVDANSNTLVNSGPLSSMKIEILALNGDFGSDDREHWSENEFNGSIIREREGRRPLVTGGDLTVTLRAGFVLISDVIFTDNSSWQRSRKFRLGARPVSKMYSETRIREASSEAFIVKDHRGEVYKKHYPPKLDDDVWRLERIAKEGTHHKKLAELGIHTVRDFLQFYSMDPNSLQRILGGGISNKIWDTIIDHAKTCVLDDKYYTYYEGGQTVGLLFNSVYKAMGVTFDGQMYEPVDKLALHDKAMVETLKRRAYKNVTEFIPIDACAFSAPSRPLTCPHAETFHGQNLGLQQLEFPVVQDPQEMLPNFGAFDTSNLSEVSRGQTHPMQALRSSFRFRDMFPLPFSGENNRSQWLEVASSSQLTPEETYPLAQTSAWGQGNAFVFSSGNEREVDLFSPYPSLNVHMPIRKPKAGWYKLRAAINLSSVRRNIPKRMWQDFYM
ncbi:calmodulin-binding protein 60 B [Euphorbia lathyris]|uniref:calmodulin-binding protein 60 B n=1 Tax=Euphorbia lathyris TaxID=212925 RepID=UPI0033137556